jgi:hypothetical protein
MTRSGSRQQPDWDGGVEQCDSFVKAAAVGFVFSLRCQAAIVFSANGSLYNNYLCLALD